MKSNLYRKIAQSWRDDAQADEYRLGRSRPSNYLNKRIDDITGNPTGSTRRSPSYEEGPLQHQQLDRVKKFARGELNRSVEAASSPGEMSEKAHRQKSFCPVSESLRGPLAARRPACLPACLPANQHACLPFSDESFRALGAWC